MQEKLEKPFTLKDFALKLRHYNMLLRSSFESGGQLMFISQVQRKLGIKPKTFSFSLLYGHNENFNLTTQLSTLQLKFQTCNVIC